MTDVTFTKNKEPFEFMHKARKLVIDYATKNGLFDDSKLTDDDVFIVWFSKTLQNWKALVSTTLNDGMYYELTHNGDKHETYIDAYKKFDNVRVPDEEN